jgi:hypothetical protein
MDDVYLEDLSGDTLLYAEHYNRHPVCESIKQNISIRSITRQSLCQAGLIHPVTLT